MSNELSFNDSALNDSSIPIPHESDPPRAGTPGGQHAVQWETVAYTLGITQGQILVGRLRSEGIPARAWQEGAGQATGLIIGKLGTGYVQVPEEFADQARELLDTPVEWDEETDFDDDEADEADDAR
jgi:hypothetical protein